MVEELQGLPPGRALVEPAHFVMGRRQLLGIRQRAEAVRLPDDQERTARATTAGAEAVAEAVRAT